MKIDRCFIKEIQTDSKDSAITRSIITLGRSLDIAVVAEGIENEEKLKVLQEENCEYGQGTTAAIRKMQMRLKHFWKQEIYNGRGGLPLVNATSVTDLLNCTIKSCEHVISMPSIVSKPSLFTEPNLQSDIGVLVGITGDLSGRLVIEGDYTTFEKLGVNMFGMSLEGEALMSFVGEIGNMIAGNACTSISQKGVQINITPPTVIVGDLKIYGFDRGILIIIEVQDIGLLKIKFLLQRENVA